MLEFPESLGGGRLRLVFPGISLFQNVGKGWEERPEAVLPNGRQVSICKGTLLGASLQDTLLEGTLKPPWLSTVFLIPSLLQHLPQCWRFPCGPLLHHHPRVLLRCPMFQILEELSKLGALVLQVDTREKEVGSLAELFLLDHMCCSLIWNLGVRAGPA